MAATRVTSAGFAEARKGYRGQRRLLIGLGFLVCFFVVNGIVGERGVLALMRSRSQNAELALSVAQLRSENARLREEARRLGSDPAVGSDPTAIEEIARRELGLIKPGERLFIIKDVPAAPAR